MKKHVFSTVFALLALAGIATTACAQDQGFTEIRPPVNTNDSGKIEVVEFMWLGCPHCFSLEPSILEWRETIPDNVVYIREAPALNPSWKEHAQSLYAARILGIEDEFVEKMFHAIHVEKKRMRKPADIAKLAGTLGVDEDKFESTMKSFAVGTKISRALQLAKGAGLNGVPAVMINGKYLTSGSIAGSHEGVINAINAAIELESGS